MDRLTHPLPAVDGRAVTLHAEHGNVNGSIATLLIRSEMDGSDPEWRFVHRIRDGRWNWAPVVTTRPATFPAYEPSAHLPGPHNPSPATSQWMDNALHVLTREETA